MDDAHLKSVLAEYRENFPASIGTKQASEIAGVAEATVYDWSSRGLLDAFKSKRRGHLRLNRDEFIKYLFDAN